MKSLSNRKISPSDPSFFGKESVGRILLKIAPPVMLAQLIQALYNIVDSFFVGRFSDQALTAVSVIYPVQLIIVAIAVGTGVGVNTYMAKHDAVGESDKADKAAGVGMVLAIASWAIFSVIAVLFMRPYVKTSATDPEAVDQAVTYGLIVSVGSIGTFLEGNWTKVLQARGNMRRPMLAQVAGALTNVVLDPLLIFGIGPFPQMGVAGAAVATVAGQILSAVIVAFGGIKKVPKLKEFGEYVKNIYLLGYSSIAMQALYTVYIVLLNVILAGFSDSAVTVLALYYKAQSFFFIPLFGLQTCIIPVLSYNYALKNYDRCRYVLRDSIIISLLFMILGVVMFEFFPDALMKLFSKSEEVASIGKIAFPIIGSSFMPAVFSLIMPVFFQAIGRGKESLFLSLLRQIFVLVPVFWAFSFIGLNYTWIAFPVAEVTAGSIGMILYFLQVKRWKAEQSSNEKT